MADSGRVKQGWKDGHARTLLGGLSKACFRDSFWGTFSLSTVSKGMILEARRHRPGVHSKQVHIERSIVHRGVRLAGGCGKISTGCSLHDPSRILMRQMMGAFFQCEKSSLVAKLRCARIRVKAATGSCDGCKASGSRPGEDSVICQVLTLRQSGAAMDTIADKLNGEGVKPRRGGKWYGSSVRYILNRATAS